MKAFDGLPQGDSNYDLYGDQASPEWSDSFNFEWIPQRFQPYNWVIHPHRHDTFLQLLYLSTGPCRTSCSTTRTGRAWRPA